MDNWEDELMRDLSRPKPNRLRKGYAWVMLAIPAAVLLYALWNALR